VPTSARSSLSSIATSGPHGRFIAGTLVSGRYRIISLLGKGGMGEVYRADDLTLGQSVALKFLPESLVDNPDAVSRFRNEVRVARQVSHPNVCRVHDVGEIDGQLFLSMEYVDGEDLASLLRRIGRLPEDKALEIARKLCAGLAAAHEKGVLHRDLKPANVMLDARGQVLLTDFGLAGVANVISGDEVRCGTPAYMSPEQLAGKEVTVRSDIYALGLVLYELFTGKRPFDGNSLDELIEAQRTNTPPSISSMVRDLDPAVERVIVHCLDPEPSRRPASALVVAAGLPGADPLAAALAAGETPSPELVAAAGEDVGLRLRVAVPLGALMLVALGFHTWASARDSMLERLRPTVSPEVLRHTARQIIRAAGYGGAVDSEHGFLWSNDFARWVSTNDKPRPDWSAVAKGRAPILKYWYREAAETIPGTMFHDQALTLGATTDTDPPPTTAGSIHVELDVQGRLLEFRAMPAQKLDAPAKPSMPDWTPLFRLAGLDLAQLKPAEPAWTFLEASDMRAAWTGLWPGSQRPLRIEAAAFSGKPVVFSLLGPWARADRTPEPSPPNPRLILLSVLLIAALVASVYLARENLRRGRGDLRGAVRLAVFVFCAQFALWLARMHFVSGIGLVGYLLVEICTASAFALFSWTVYLAAEPFARRYWPQTLIGWTRVLSGRIRDGIVGRDVLIGCATTLLWGTIIAANRTLNPEFQPSMPSTELLIGFRGALGEYLENIPSMIWAALVLFFVIFLLRLLLRSDWLAGAAFTALFVGAAVVGSASTTDVVLTAIIYGTFAFVAIRFGLLAVAAMMMFDAIGDMPASFDSSAWYYPWFVLTVLLSAAAILWAFAQSIRRRPASTA
jgi:serine/threonine-protein kinase